MLVLAVDTATPAVTAGLVRVDDRGEPGTAGIETLAVRVTDDPRAHAEVLTPQILECLSSTGHTPADLDAVVVGVGPGPFTGLRVGMATAAAFGDALDVPVHGVCSLDAIAADVLGADADGTGPGAGESAGDLLVVTDARRREVYWARYSGGVRLEGPGVCRPADLKAEPSQRIAGSRPHVDLFELPAHPVATPSPAGLVAVAVADLLAGVEPEPLVPLYLRRPDAVETADRKKK
ncbi:MULTISPECIES: tRNA (adenosine(37)-N6)-threonylcarbamoyltransferase complex dimerization subunit type 1 TsaB [Rhodococcus]|uniref:tRNA (adenosine(37)-N6)-threonylcarbamoyltransferase complex dimerization subunit type 1 TsaB n=1 Tax=Rhodococcus TaxID=1827 RepID=UPI000299E532|nr:MULTISPECIES: tRNA (adenosine(37)-N6)-threonylcarbamoyltransferase complex dimerization subunit type 1 TsaB [Rhodococcus]ATQ28574.1 tRNA (adenosine(37)-N6)-threonylcarbamoyltransferase complex dimerization subunit type 1 TsaB [Rhodococcus ruber]MBD8055352.1 tRNA (adenosine(37)-N6)-threonylcarbamoyltransferase complex dimerization subunit type 1 TsaB [Rhodococcus ruber]MDO1481248.1 tRNA (adenosine(37)-N6)-threonylcarbamoyltransferase complex dimerization subunit type 1 TsaB [Rhodococcus ruber]